MTRDKVSRYNLRHQQFAHKEVNKAIRNGTITRPDTCEICGAMPGVSSLRTLSGRPASRTLVVGHHWRGYLYPLDIWWLCASCNLMLGSRHDGSLTKEQAALFIARRKNGRWSFFTETLAMTLIAAGEQPILKEYDQFDIHRILL